MLLLTFFAGAYAHQAEPPPTSLPPSLALRSSRCRGGRGRPPILPHAGLAMHNWRRLDPSGPTEVENLVNLVGIHGSMDAEGARLPGGPK